MSVSVIVLLLKVFGVYGPPPESTTKVSIVDGDSAMFMEGGYAMERCYALHVFETLP